MQLDALHELGDAIGLHGEGASSVRIEGSDPVLATRFRVGEASAVALAACGVAAADLWALRSERRQRVEVDVRAAAASLLSFLLTRVVDGDGPGYGSRASITDSFRTRDAGWFFFHGSFPHCQREALALLDCSSEEPDRAGVERAIAGWDAPALEAAFAERGLCGARARTQSEWRKHPQGLALAAHPVVEILKVGDSPPEGLSPTAGSPLDGVRALDLTRVLAGPTCGRTLAQHGADVLRIGSPKLPSIPHFVMDTSFGKRSAYLDLKQDSGAECLRKLIRGADVFTQGYRGGALERLGFDVAAVASLRPGIVYTSINCYGHVGPWAERPGWEQLAQTVSGISHEQGDADAGPSLIPAAPTDYTTGYLAALGTLVALRRRATEGGSYHVRASLSRTAMWIQDLGRSDELGAGLDPSWLAPMLSRSESAFGSLEHLGPVLRMSETPPRWSKPSVPLGTHEPEWESRASNASDPGAG